MGHSPVPSSVSGCALSSREHNLDRDSTGDKGDAEPGEPSKSEVRVDGDHGTVRSGVRATEPQREHRDGGCRLGAFPEQIGCHCCRGYRTSDAPSAGSGAFAPRNQKCHTRTDDKSKSDECDYRNSGQHLHVPPVLRSPHGRPLYPPESTLRSVVPFERKREAAGKRLRSTPSSARQARTGDPRRRRDRERCSRAR
jgi:hypothetical protein